MLMIGKHNHPTIHELVLEAGLGTLVVYLSICAMSFFSESANQDTLSSYSIEISVNNELGIIDSNNSYYYFLQEIFPS
jgi:hypothetical protein